MDGDNQPQQIQQPMQSQSQLPPAQPKPKGKMLAYVGVLVVIIAIAIVALALLGGKGTSTQTTSTTTANFSPTTITTTTSIASVGKLNGTLSRTQATNILVGSLVFYNVTSANSSALTKLSTEFSAPISNEQNLQYATIQSYKNGSKIQAWIVQNVYQSTTPTKIYSKLFSNYSLNGGNFTANNATQDGAVYSYKTYSNGGTPMPSVHLIAIKGSLVTTLFILYPAASINESTLVNATIEAMT